MAPKLPLPEEAKVWRLDAQTREAGRRGLASARAALAAHRPVEAHGEQPPHPLAAVSGPVRRSGESQPRGDLAARALRMAHAHRPHAA